MLLQALLIAQQTYAGLRGYEKAGLGCSCTGGKCLVVAAIVKHNLEEQACW